MLCSTRWLPGIGNKLCRTFIILCVWGRPLLSHAARHFIYSKSRDVCQELDSFGVHYSACLGEHDECVDPVPGSYTTPIPRPSLASLQVHT